MESEFWKSLRELGVPSAAIPVAALALLFLFKTPPGRRLREYAATWCAVRVRWPLVSRRRYRTAILSKDRYVPLPFRRDAHQRIELVDVYVEPAAGSGSLRGQLRIDDPEPFRHVVTGDPGAGKSLLLQSLLYRWAVGTGSARIPARVILNRLDADRPLESLKDLLVGFFALRGVPRADRFIDHALSHGRLLILLDALDEVAPPHRPGIESLIALAAEHYPQCQFVVTCRAAAYTGRFTDFAVLRLSRFGDAQVSDFLNNWSGLAGSDPVKVAELGAALKISGRLRELAGSPLLLTYMAFLYGRTDSTGTLPHSRAEFYEQVVDHLLTDPKLANEFRAEVKLAVLERLARESFPAQRGQVHEYLPLAALIRQVIPDLSRSDTDRLLDEIVERSGLLQRADGGYVFPHLTIQEYFVARSFTGRPDDLLAEFTATPYPWWEVVKLWCGGASPAPESMMDVIWERGHELVLLCLAETRDGRYPQMPLWITDALQILADEEDYAPALTALVRHPGSIGGQAVATVSAILSQTVAGAESFRWTVGRVVPQICRILAASRRPEAAELLLDLTDRVEGASEALCRMGDVAVEVLMSALGAAGESGESARLVGLLAQMQTLGATTALVGLLPERGQSAGSATSVAAAWQLAGRVRDAEFEQRLKVNRVTAGPREGWAWRPFETRGHPEFARLMCAVAEQLWQPCETLESVQRIDPRLALFLLLECLAETIGRSYRGPTTESDVQALQRIVDTAQLRELLVGCSPLVASQNPTWAEQVARIVSASISPELRTRLVARLRNSMRGYRQVGDWPSIVRGAVRESAGRHVFIYILSNPLRGFGNEVLAELERERGMGAKAP